MDKNVQKLINKKHHERTEEDWDAIWDAQSLAKAEQIKSDSARLARAQQWAQALLAEENEQAEAMKKVANG